MLVTLPLALIATVPVPLKFTQALDIYKGAVPDTVGICAELIVGVVKVGEVPNTTEPDPVEDVTPVPPSTTGNTNAESSEAVVTVPCPGAIT
jgi:hypothetical protein